MSSTQRCSFRGLLQTENLSDNIDLLYKEDLSEVFYVEKTFQRFSMQRRPFRGLLHREGLSDVFYIEKIFQRSSTGRIPFRQHRSSVQREVFCIKMTCQMSSIIQPEVLSEVFNIEIALQRSSIQRKSSVERIAFRGVLYTEDLLKVLYRQKTFHWSIGRRPLRGLLYKEKHLKVLNIEKTFQRPYIIKRPLNGRRLSNAL